MKTNCAHPNCKLVATMPHPSHQDKEYKQLCAEHYLETLEYTTSSLPIISLTTHKLD